MGKGEKGGTGIIKTVGRLGKGPELFSRDWDETLVITTGLDQMDQTTKTSFPGETKS